MVMGWKGWLIDPALAAWEQQPEILIHMDVGRSGAVWGIGLCLGRVFGWSPGWSCRHRLYAKEGGSPARGLGPEEEEGFAL